MIVFDIFAVEEKFGGYLFMMKIGIGGIGWPMIRDGLPKKKKNI